MVKISNGLDTMTVTKGAYEGIYKFQGYSLVHDYATTTTVKPVEADVTDDNNYIVNDMTEVADDQEETGEEVKVELKEKPISQWSKDELKEFAEANGISLEGIKSTKEVRDIIKKFIDEN